MRTLILILLFLFNAMPGAAHDGVPLVEIEPNAILKERDVLAIKVRGIEAGRTVWLQVVRDCVRSVGVGPDCAPLLERESRPADPKGIVRDRLAGGELDGLPEQEKLWLRVTRWRDQPSDAAPNAGFATFRLTEDACTVFASVIATFVGGGCDTGLRQALRRHRSRSMLKEVTFEVRRLRVADDGPSGEPRTVPGTRGTTGITWENADHLVVSRAPSATTGGVQAGLYCVHLGAASPATLWTPGEEDRARGLYPAAPYVLEDGRVVFVRQSLTGQPQPGETAAWLSVLADGEVSTEVELPYRVHQIVGADEAGARVLVLTLGIDDNRPAFLVADLEARTAEVVGYDHSVYLAAMRSPDGSQAAVAYEDNSGRYGWDLVLTDGSGKVVNALVSRRKLHDMMPAWRPDGTEIAYLAEVGRLEDP